ncbi:MAG: hypothetical protein R3F61_26345 [Myxococcota bacterium]
MEAPEPDDPWIAPASEPWEDSWPGVVGFVAVLVFHGLAAISASVWGVGAWLTAFGLLQLGFLVPLVALMVWRGAPRSAVVGVFCGAALAFLGNVALVAVSGWGASLV